MAAFRRCIAVVIACMPLILAGCGGKAGGDKAKADAFGPGSLPGNAKLIVEKAGGFAYIAPQPGTAYVVDPRSGRVVFTTPMNFRDQFFFDPGKKRIVTGGRIIPRGDLRPERVHRLYFVGG